MKPGTSSQAVSRQRTCRKAEPSDPSPLEMPCSRRNQVILDLAPLHALGFEPDEEVHRAHARTCELPESAPRALSDQPALRFQIRAALGESWA